MQVDLPKVFYGRSLVTLLGYGIHETLPGYHGLVTAGNFCLPKPLLSLPAAEADLIFLETVGHRPSGHRY